MAALGDPSSALPFQCLVLLSFGQAVREEGTQFHTLDGVHLSLKSHFNMFILDTQRDASFKPVFVLNPRPKEYDTPIFFFPSSYIFFLQKNLQISVGSKKKYVSFKAKRLRIVYLRGISTI